MPTTTIPGGGSPGLRGHLAVPAVGDGPFPGVVVLHEIFGLTDDVRQIADRFASAGHVALAPDLFSAGGAARCLRSTFRALGAGQGRAFDDIEAARRVLAGRPDCTGKVGVVGFCMGGGFALVASTRGFSAAAPNYGPPPKELDAVLSGACPVVASYGRRDRGLPGAAAKLEDALTRAGVPHDVVEYPDAGHSFMNRHNAGPFSPLERIAGLSFHEPSAEDAWARILRFFGTHLAA